MLSSRVVVRTARRARRCWSSFREAGSVVAWAARDRPLVLFARWWAAIGWFAVTARGVSGTRMVGEVDWECERSRRWARRLSMLVGSGECGGLDGLAMSLLLVGIAGEGSGDCHAS